MSFEKKQGPPNKSFGGKKPFRPYNKPFNRSKQQGEGASTTPTTTEAKLNKPQKPQFEDRPKTEKRSYKVQKNINLQHGYLTERYTLRQMFPVTFVCKNPRCDGEYKVHTLGAYVNFREDPHCACGYKVQQYLLKED